VSFKGIEGELLGCFGHDPVSRYFGDDGSSCDGTAEGVAIDDGLLEPHPGSGEATVYEGELRLGIQILEGLGHGAQTGLEDADLVDDVVFYAGHRPGDGLSNDDLVELFSFLRRETLGVRQFGMVEVGGEDDRRRHHRAGKRPPPNLVYTRHEAISP